MILPAYVFESLRAQPVCKRTSSVVGFEQRWRILAHRSASLSMPCLRATLLAILLRQLLCNEFIRIVNEFVHQILGNACAGADGDPMLFVQVVTSADGGIITSQRITMVRVDLDGNDLEFRIVFGHDQEHFLCDFPNPQVRGERVPTARARQSIGYFPGFLLVVFSA